MKKQLFSTFLAILLMTGLVVWGLAIKNPTNPDFKISFLDVGQGDSIYLQLPDKKDVLIDGGPNEQVLTELGEVMPFNDRKIDLLIVSHNHSDHLSGINLVLNRYSVGEIWISGATHTSNDYLEFLQTIKDKKIKVKTVKAGDEFSFDQTKVKVFFPIEDWVGKKPFDQHSADVVTRWDYGKFCVFLTGDLDTKLESEMMSKEQLSKCDILKVPHHGGKESLSKTFLAALQPKVAIISVGAHNQFGHPTQKILSMLKTAQIEIYRTDQDGRVTVQSDGEKYQITKEKK